MKRFILGFIYLYRWLISPFLPPSCKFTPTCSRYAISAIECHGVSKGLWMTLKRLCRCHPFSTSESPYDPVPKLKRNPNFIPSQNINNVMTNNPANSGYTGPVKRVHRA